MQPGFDPQREERDRHRDTRQRNLMDRDTDSSVGGVCYTYTVYKQAKTLEEDVRCHTLFLSIFLP